MNNYEVTQCSKCKDVLITSSLGTIKVASHVELKKVVDLLLAGKSIDTVAGKYCRTCLYPIDSHKSKEEHQQHPEWLPYHEPEPQTGNRYC